MALTTAQIQQAYVTFFSRPADPVGLAYWQAYTGSVADLYATFAQQTEYSAAFSGLTSAQKVNVVYQNLFGRDAEATGLLYWAGKVESGAITVANLALAVSAGSQGTDLVTVNSRVSAATSFSAALDTPAEILGYTGATANAAAKTWLAGVTTAANLATAVAAIDTATAAVVAVGGAAGSTFTLTTSVDSVSGTTGNDTFSATDSTLTIGDTLNGGAGTDTLSLIAANALTAVLPTGATLTSVENINIIGAAAITANTSAIAGVTSASATNSGANNIALTGAATTDLSVTNATLAAGTVAVDGGKNVTVTTGELTASGGAGGTLTVGGTSAPVGTVTITQAATSGNVTTGSTATGGAIAVTGGTVVNVNQTIAPTSAAATTVLTGNVTVNNTGGAVTVTGTASTTAVTVTQSAAVTAVASATIGRVGIIDGAVTVNDANRASTTAAGTIETVTLTNAGAATVNSGALKTLNLGGSLVTVDAGTLGALTTAANTSLALNLTGAVSTGAVTIDSDIKTLNISGNTTASTLNSLVASGATAINVSGDAKVTLTGNTTAAVTAINVTNTKGAGFGTAIGAGVTFTGGAGDDSVVLSTGFTKANTMGAGNDTVTYGGAASTTAGAVGSMAAGDGTDTIIMADADAAGADGSSAFNTAFTGFEVLRISDAFVTDDLDLDGLNSVSKVILAAGATTATMNNLPNGGTVQFKDTNSTGTTTINVKSALVGASDVLNLEISNTGDVYAAATVAAANVETINISAPDAAVAPALGSAAAINTMTLTATSAKTVTVSGNNGLTLGNSGNAAITLFDASGVVANDTAASTFVAATTDTAANLAVTFASANTTATADVTIKGGAGNDTLTGTIAKDTIFGGAGADAIYADNAGNKATTATANIAIDAATTGVVTVKVGFAGLETPVFTAVKADATNTDLPEIGVAIRAALAADPVLSKLIAISGTAPAVIFTSLVDGVLIAPTVTFTATGATTPTYTVGALTAGTAGTVAVDSIDGGAGADVLVGGGGADTITTGAGADSVFFVKAQSNLATMATITDFTFATGGTSNDKIIIGDVTAVASNKAAVQDLSSAATLAAAFDAAALANTTDLGTSVFVWGGNEYVFVETTGATATYAAGDFAVKLTGLPLAVGATIAGSGFDAV